MRRFTRAFKWQAWGTGRAAGRAGQTGTYDDMVNHGKYPSSADTLFTGARKRDVKGGQLVRTEDDDLNEAVHGGGLEGEHEAGHDTGDGGDGGAAHGGGGAGNDGHDHGDGGNNMHMHVDLDSSTRHLATEIRDAPDDRRRVNEEDLQMAGAVTHAKIIEATVVITKELSKDRSKMEKWLNDKGFRFELASNHQDVHLQQLVAYWHLLPTLDQIQLKLTKPIIRMVPFGPGLKEDYHSLSAFATYGLDVTGDIVTVVRLNFPQEITAAKYQRKALDEYLKKDSYTIGAATVEQRYYESQLADNASFVPDDPDAGGTAIEVEPAHLWGVYAMAHEFSHVRQDLASNILHDQKKLIEARVKFGFFQKAGFTPVEVYQTDVTDDAGDGHEEPYRRALPDLQRSITRRAFLKTANGEDRSLKAPRDPASAHAAALTRLKAEFPSPGNRADVGAEDILDAMHRTIQRVLAPLIDNVNPVSPVTSHEWVASLKGLDKFMTYDGTMPTIGKASFTSSVEWTDPESDPFHSVVDNLEVLTDGQISLIDGETSDFDHDSGAKLKTEARQLATWGLRAVDAGLQVFDKNIERSVNLQKQASRLFGDLIGNFSSYANGHFKDAVMATKGRLKDVVMATDKDNLMGGALNVDVQTTLNELRARWRVSGIDVTSQPGFDRITDRDWYQVGSQMGFFNTYTAEYDAEAASMAVSAPEEFIEMYKRFHRESEADKEVKTPVSEQVLKQAANQATFAFSRAMYERGKVPQYLGDDEIERLTRGNGTTPGIV